MQKILGISALAGMMILNSTAAVAADREVVSQVALLQSLTLGHFNGSIKVKDWKKFGDTGIGTFDGLNGEMVVLDGVVYQGDQNCLAHVMGDNETVPFSNITFFEKDFFAKLENIPDKTALESHLNALIKNYGANSFYMIKIPAKYATILIRSEAKQYEPYPTLVQALEATQKEVTLQDVEGTIVGLYCPPYMAGLNSVGWHFHFISADKKYAGHVLNMNITSGEVQFDKTDNFTLRLPENADFQKLNLAEDLREDIRKAENDSQGAE